MARRSRVVRSSVTAADKYAWVFTRTPRTTAITKTITNSPARYVGSALRPEPGCHVQVFQEANHPATRPVHRLRSRTTRLRMPIRGVCS